MKAISQEKGWISRTKMNTPQRKHKPVLYNQIVGTAGPHKTWECLSPPKFVKRFAEKFEETFVYILLGKQFWMRAKAQKPYFILSAANRLIPPPSPLETGNKLLSLLPLFASSMIQSQDQIWELSGTFSP